MLMNVTDAPKISIITCFLNVEPYIQETIESILQQDYINWELVLIDDGSTDKSTGIAKNFATKFPGKIIYLEHENHINKGSSASRNLGIKKSSGALITFLDADDILLPDMLSHLLNLMQQYPVALICEASEYWYDWNDPSKKNEIIYIGTEQDRMYQPPELMLNLYPLGSGAAPCICGMLVKKDIVDKHGAFDESFGGMYDDQSFLIKFYLHEAVYISSTCKNKYRQRPGSLVHSSHGQSVYLSERKYFLKWLKNYLKKNNIAYPQVDILLQKALMPYKTSYFIKKTLPKKFKRIIKRVFN
jgi:glycosyltransferase involved in cell wall biosynthesis